jgi:hypothetical protein
VNAYIQETAENQSKKEKGDDEKDVQEVTPLYVLQGIFTDYT